MQTRIRVGTRLGRCGVLVSPAQVTPVSGSSMLARPDGLASNDQRSSASIRVRAPRTRGQITSPSPGGAAVLPDAARSSRGVLVAPSTVLPAHFRCYELTRGVGNGVQPVVRPSTALPPGVAGLRTCRRHYQQTESSGNPWRRLRSAGLRGLDRHRRAPAGVGQRAVREPGRCAVDRDRHLGRQVARADVEVGRVAGDPHLGDRGE
jgi:hypothetical protein